MLSSMCYIEKLTIWAFTAMHDASLPTKELHGCTIASKIHVNQILKVEEFDLSIITASQVLCFSWAWMDKNFLCTICTILSISFGVIGLVRLCSRRRFMTCVVNSLQACSYFSSSWNFDTKLLTIWIPGKRLGYSESFKRFKLKLGSKFRYELS